MVLSWMTIFSVTTLARVLAASWQMVGPPRLQAPWPPPFPVVHVPRTPPSPFFRVPQTPPFPGDRSPQTPPTPSPVRSIPPTPVNGYDSEEEYIIALLMDEADKKAADQKGRTDARQNDQKAQTDVDEKLKAERKAKYERDYRGCYSRAQKRQRYNELGLAENDEERFGNVCVEFSHPWRVD